jgi:hypothetical protein
LRTKQQPTLRAELKKAKQAELEMHAVLLQAFFDPIFNNHPAVIVNAGTIVIIVYCFDADRLGFVGKMYYQCK